jgi:hypothetical protein
MQEPYYEQPKNQHPPQYYPPPPTEPKHNHNYQYPQHPQYPQYPPPSTPPPSFTPGGGVENDNFNTGTNNKFNPRPKYHDLCMYSLKFLIS